MSAEADQLWAGALNQPDDDLPRLVLADYLEEHGDPRGGFIRTQCHLALMPVTAPGYSEAKQREAALLAAHREHWLQALRPGVERARFWRGFVEEAQATPMAFVSHGQEWRRLEPLRELHLHQSGVMPRDTIEALVRVPALRGVTTLKLNTDRGIRDEDVEHLARCPHLAGLAVLDLSDNWITDRGAGFLVRSPYLAAVRRLCLRGNLLGAAGKQALWRQFGTRAILEG
jgi:uncharacterized protein (TIGR02996 family)